MAIAITPVTSPKGNYIHAMGDMYKVFLTLAFSGSYATGGDGFDPTPYIPGGSSVICVDANGFAGYGYEYDSVNKKLKLFSSANTELAAGAYNAALTGDTNIVVEVTAA